MSGRSEARNSRPFPFLKNFPVSVQRGGADAAERLVGQVIGAINGKRVILAGIPAGRLQPGEEVVVRLAAGSTVVGFQTRVQETYGTEDPLYLLAFPDNIESLNLRRGERMNLFVPAEVQYASAKADGPHAADLALLQGRMLNLSREGCCLSTKRPLTVNQPIRLAFALPGARNSYRVEAKVLRHLGPPRDGVFVQGVQFEKQTQHLAVLADLQQWIAQNLPFALAN